LRELTKKGVPWKWEQEHQVAMRTIANSLTSSNVMSYFDLQKKTEVIVDVSPVGLGVILVKGNESEQKACCSICKHQDAMRTIANSLEN
jgi:hypothetical protein